MAIDPLKLKKFLQDYDSLQYAVALRVARSQAREECNLALGAALLRLNIHFCLSWEEIASRVEGIGDKSFAYRLARREKTISAIGYSLATESINRILLSMDSPAVDFPPYPNQKN
jgi:hypothetical protein